jgi:RNA polymerase-interacting CarD/CdnL/TRCF family regulator
MINNLNVGDCIVDGGKIFEIFKKKEETENGQTISMIYFKPVYDDGSGLICSIPLHNLNDSLVRKAASVQEIKQSLKILTDDIEFEEEIDTTVLEGELNGNRVELSAKVANILWKNKGVPDKNFSSTKKRILKKAIHNLIEEYAFVMNTSLEKAENKILSHLSK